MQWLARSPCRRAGHGEPSDSSTSTPFGRDRRVLGAGHSLDSLYAPDSSGQHLVSAAGCEGVDVLRSVAAGVAGRQFDPCRGAVTRTHMKLRSATDVICRVMTAVDTALTSWTSSTDRFLTKPLRLSPKPVHDALLMSSRVNSRISAMMRACVGRDGTGYLDAGNRLPWLQYHPWPLLALTPLLSILTAPPSHGTLGTLQRTCLQSPAQDMATSFVPELASYFRHRHLLHSTSV